MHQQLTNILVPDKVHFPWFILRNYGVAMSKNICENFVKWGQHNKLHPASTFQAKIACLMFPTGNLSSGKTLPRQEENVDIALSSTGSYNISCTLLRVWELALTILYHELINRNYRIEGKYNPFTLEVTLNSQCIFYRYLKWSKVTSSNQSKSPYTERSCRE